MSSENPIVHTFKLGDVVKVSERLVYYIQKCHWHKRMYESIGKFARIRRLELDEHIFIGTPLDGINCPCYYLRFLNQNKYDGYRSTLFLYPQPALVYYGPECGFQKNESVLMSNDISKLNEINWIPKIFLKYENNYFFGRNDPTPFKYCIKLNGNEHLQTDTSFKESTHNETKIYCRSNL